MSSHIPAKDSILAGEGRTPMIPELCAATDAMLEPHRFFFGRPGIGIVVYFVEHLTIIRGDFCHFLPLFTAAVSTARAVHRMNALWKAVQAPINHPGNCQFVAAGEKGGRL